METKKGSFRQSLIHALEGVRDTFQSERNMKIHALSIVIVVILGVFLQISRSEWIACISLFGLVIGAEMLNTALEITVDIIISRRDPRAKRVKDTAAGAVLMVSLAAAVVGLIIFVPKLLALIA
ncbi:MAG TPA: diacylglycerol kinase family protein [Candidatus Limiplasma sp.]|nr:diacylglycerol kinase family protein [Candidatus Limiplasma sp.]